MSEPPLMNLRMFIHPGNAPRNELSSAKRLPRQGGQRRGQDFPRSLQLRSVAERRLCLRGGRHRPGGRLWRDLRGRLPGRGGA